ncbi:MAG: rod shape-determining protein RodA [Parcubacteria group bacterium]|jgi:rod shape determining protein RodA
MVRSILKLDWVIIIATLFLIGLSLAILFPISYSGEKVQLSDSHFMRQLIFAVIGIVVFLFFSFSDYRFLKGYSTVLFLVGLIFLLAVLIFGKTIRGTSGWFGVGIFHLQPVEPFKLIVAVILAKYFSLNIRSIESGKHIFISAVPIFISVFLILWQPDLGSAIVVVCLWLGVLFVSGVNKKYLAVILIIGLLVGLLGWAYFLKDYQKARINALFNPTSDPQGSGYNVIQSTVAVGSGGMWGKGLGHGSQSQLNFLPEKHTDFIFAVVSEELGLFGAILVLSLTAVIITRLLYIAKYSLDNFGKLLVSAIAIFIFVQAFINIGMNLGIVPVTGIPLPLLSYGGSSIITILASLGIAESVYRKGRFDYGLSSDEA